MPARQEEPQTDDHQHRDRGFVSAPTVDQLRPTEREEFLLNALWNWQEASAKSQIVLGQPLRA